MATNLYLLDTNYLLRSLVSGEKKQVAEVELLFENARKGRCKLFVIPEIILEVEYVLRKVYRFDRESVGNDLSSIVNTDFVTVDNEDNVRIAIDIYRMVNVDLVDIFLFLASKERGMGIKTFDKDFAKIQKVYNKLTQV